MVSRSLKALFLVLVLAALARPGWSTDKLFDDFKGSPWILQTSSEVGHHGRISGDGSNVILSSGEVRPGDSGMNLMTTELFRFVSGNYRITARLRANRQGMTTDGPYGLSLGFTDTSLSNATLEFLILRTGGYDGNQLELITPRGQWWFGALDSTQWHTYEMRFQASQFGIFVDGTQWGSWMNLSAMGFPDKEYRACAGTGGRHYSLPDNILYIDQMKIESGVQTLFQIDDDNDFLWDYEMGNGLIYQENDRLVMKNIVVKRLGDFDSVSYLMSRQRFRPVSGKWRLSARMKANVQGCSGDGPYGLVFGFLDDTRQNFLFLMPGNGDGTQLSVISPNSDLRLGSFDATIWHNYEFSFGGGMVTISIDGITRTTQSIAALGLGDLDYRAMIQCIGRGVSDTLLNIVETDWVKLEDLSPPPGMVAVDLSLKTSAGAGIPNTAFKYYDAAWKDLGTTDATGRLSCFLRPATYSFRVIHEGEVNDKLQNVVALPEVQFRTIPTTVRLKNSEGVPIDSGAVKYYAGGWRDYGATSGGQVSREMLPGNYTFRMTYEGASNDKVQNVGTAPDVEFRTTRAVVQLMGSTGAPLDTGTIKFYAGAWRDFGTTSGGQAFRQMLPGTYSFRMTYRNVSQDKVQAVGGADPVVFQTGRVLSDSGSCVSYYAGAWLSFMDGIELLPAAITFRFQDGTPDIRFTIAPATDNHIH